MGIKFIGKIPLKKKKMECQEFLWKIKFQLKKAILKASPNFNGRVQLYLFYGASAT